MTIPDPDEWAVELRERRSRLWDTAASEGCDCILAYGAASHGEPFRYITNFMPVLGDGFALLRSPTDIECVLNFDWQLPEAFAHSGIPAWQGTFDASGRVAELLRATGPRCVGIVGMDRLPHTTFERFRSEAPGAEWIDLSGAALYLRRTKSDLEIRLLAEAGRITDLALDDLREFVRPGHSEHEIAARAAFSIHSAGAALSFEPTVIAGDENPMTIRMPTARKVRPGDAVMIDVGASFQGYQADAARTFVLGEASARQRDVWEVVRAAYAAAVNAIRPGVPARTLHIEARAVIEAGGYELVHRIGHGIGLSTSFEWPSLDTEAAPLEAGMTFCIEPGIYVRGAGNMKCEDDVVVTSSGYELLTRASAELEIPVR